MMPVKEGPANRHTTIKEFSLNRKMDRKMEGLKSLRKSATPGYLPKPAAPKGKMGGGMMNKPMGYKHGTMVKARGCKLGRTRPTKMY